MEVHANTLTTETEHVYIHVYVYADVHVGYIGGIWG